MKNTSKRSVQTHGRHSSRPQSKPVSIYAILDPKTRKERRARKAEIRKFLKHGGE